MNPGFDWTVIINPKQEDVHTLRDNLRAYNVAQARAADGYSMAIFLREKDGRLVGGIDGRLWGEVLEIDYLWIDQKLRGLGLGKRLILSIEKEAQARGCRLVTLDTFDFQAPKFYQALGYELFGTIKGFGQGHEKYFFRKALI